MSPQEVLSLCADLGLDLRAEDGNLYVSPAEKLPATLRTQLAEQKEVLLEILHPPLLDSPKAALRRLEKQLEKQLGTQGPEPQPRSILIHHRAHDHSEAEIEAAQRRIWAAALARYHVTYNEGDVGLTVLHVGHDTCTVCTELHASSPPAQAAHQ